MKFLKRRNEKKKYFFAGRKMKKRIEMSLLIKWKLSTEKKTEKKKTFVIVL